MSQLKYVIIGGGLTGLSLAHRLHQDQQKVVLLEATESLGGRFRGGDIAELNFITPSEKGLDALEWLKNLSPGGLSWHEEELPPVHFESAHWHDFLGFSDFPSTVVNELSFFNQSKQWILEPGLGQVTRTLIEQLPIQARTLAEVTGFEVVDGKMVACVINGQERIEGDRFIFTPSPHLLNTLLATDSLKPTNRSRLVKQDAWTSITLTLTHKQPIESAPAVRFVLGTGKEFEPVVGRVWPNQSAWMIPVSYDQEEDMEHVGNCLRYMKRTLKRVWPELLDNVAEEKLRVRSQALGKLDLKLKAGISFPEISGFWLADSRFSDVPGVLGTVAIALELSRLFVAEPQKTMLSDCNAELE
jgi:hypothetical protein